MFKQAMTNSLKAIRKIESLRRKTENLKKNPMKILALKIQQLK